MAGHNTPELGSAEPGEISSLGSWGDSHLCLTQPLTSASQAKGPAPVLGTRDAGVS